MSQGHWNKYLSAGNYAPFYLLIICLFCFLTDYASYVEKSFIYYLKLAIMIGSGLIAISNAKETKCLF